MSVSNEATLFKTVLLFGPPGSGKGTMGKLLSQAGGHCHLSSGDIFRGLDPLSPSGKLFCQYACEGKLVPDEVTIKIWHNYVEGLIATNRYFPEKQILLLDGVPRTEAQARLLEKYLNIVSIFVLEINNVENLFLRMKKRAKIEGRMDDLDENVLKTRLDIYKKETIKLLDFYPSSLICKINADSLPLEVLRDVLNTFILLK